MKQKIEAGFLNELNQFFKVLGDNYGMYEEVLARLHHSTKKSMNAQYLRLKTKLDILLDDTDEQSDIPKLP